MKSGKEVEKKGMVIFKKSVFGDAGFMSAFNTVQWMKIGAESDIGIRSKIKRFIKIFTPEKEMFDELRIEMLKEFAVKNEKDQTYKFEDPEKQELFSKKMKPLFDETFEIKHEAFAIDDDIRNKISIGEELALEKFGVIK